MRNVEIPFQVTWGGEPISCDDANLALTDLRFYASNLELLTVDGDVHVLRELALIDLENGQGTCQNGTTETNRKVSGSVPVADYAGLRFTLGVPFALNHADPLAAQPPLDDPAMHWHWRSGYKFLRAGVRSENDGFWIHVGSAGCQGTVGNITDCRFPNRVAVELDEFDLGKQSVAIDLEALFKGINLADGERSDCSSGPPEDTCIAPFRAFGIDFASGQRLDVQQVFSATP